MHRIITNYLLYILKDAVHICQLSGAYFLRRKKPLYKHTKRALHNGVLRLFSYFIPRALYIRSLALFISWNFFSAARLTSSPNDATLSG